MDRVRRIAVMSVLLVALAPAFSRATATAAAKAEAQKAVPVKVDAASMKETTAILTSIPQIPLIETVTAEGLGALVDWKPDPASNHVTLYTLSARVVPGSRHRVWKWRRPTSDLRQLWLVCLGGRVVCQDSLCDLDDRHKCQRNKRSQFDLQTGRSLFGSEAKPSCHHFCRTDQHGSSRELDCPSDHWR